VLPTNVKPRRFKSLLMASDYSGVLAGTSLIDRQAFCFGSWPTNPQMHGGLSLLDVEAVVEQAVENGLADGGVVVGLWGHVQGPSAEVVAAGAASLIFCIGNFQPGDSVIGQGAETAVKEAFALAPSAAGGARGAFRGAADACDAFVAEHGLCPSGRQLVIPYRVSHQLPLTSLRNEAASQRSAGGPAAVRALGRWQPGVAGELIQR
jgi:hypothetical protein